MCIYLTLHFDIYAYLEMHFILRIFLVMTIIIKVWVEQKHDDGDDDYNVFFFQFCVTEFETFKAFKDLFLR